MNLNAEYKIVFAGSMGAGKTTAIDVLSDIETIKTDVKNTDLKINSKQMTTVGIDYGEMRFDDGTRVALYGTPGQERFNFLWKHIIKGALGVIILIANNSLRPLDDLDFYVDYFEEHAPDVHIIIGITMTDMPSNVQEKHYHKILKKRENVHPLFVVDAREPEDINLLVEVMLSMLEA